MPAAMASRARRAASSEAALRTTPAPSIIIRWS
jgi:hypothetical protein